MGWSSMHRTTPVKDWFISEWYEGYKVLDVKIVHRTELYAAVQSPKGDVFACIYLLRYSKGWDNFSYKSMDETCMPYYFKCPQSILDKLTPTTNENANEWRRICLENKLKVNNK
jgi:hypothetical protein